MNKLKEEKAITMVALIITITVMLIIASITIRITLGDSGISKKAKDARDSVEKASIYKDIIEAVETSRKKSGKVNFDTLQTKIESISENLECTMGNELNTLTIDTGDTSYVVGEYGSITEE